MEFWDNVKVLFYTSMHCNPKYVAFPAFSLDHLSQKSFFTSDRPDVTGISGYLIKLLPLTTTLKKLLREGMNLSGGCVILLCKQLTNSVEGERVPFSTAFALQKVLKIQLLLVKCSLGDRRYLRISQTFFSYNWAKEKRHYNELFNIKLSDQKAILNDFVEEIKETKSITTWTY